MKTPIDLIQVLTNHEDAKSAIAVYKEANHIISQFEEIKQMALGLAEAELRSTGEVGHKTTIGSCGWTQPKAKQLNKEAWQKAVAESTDLAAVQINYDRAKATLEKVQGPFMALPPGRFFIR